MVPLASILDLIIVCFFIRKKCSLVLRVLAREIWSLRLSLARALRKVFITNLNRRKQCPPISFRSSSSLPEQSRLNIVPVNRELGDLFKWVPERIQAKSELDSVRRTNLNVIERLISSASQQSDRTLGAMYSVICLTQISYRCRNAYPWLTE